MIVVPMSIVRELPAGPAASIKPLLMKLPNASMTPACGTALLPGACAVVMVVVLSSVAVPPFRAT